VNTVGESPAEELSVGREISRFPRLFVVGLAWSVPLLPAVWVNDEQGAAVHPRLAHVLAQHSGQVFFAMLLLCCVGVAVVAVLGRRSATGSVGWALVPVALVSAVVIVFTAFGASFRWWTLGALVILATSLAFVFSGVAVTFATLWRRRRWLALVWLPLWLGAATFIWIATEQTADSDPSPAVGFLILGALAALLFVALLAAVAGSVFSSLSDSLHEARRIEQADQADSSRSG
jgi:hypothetical protein